ncbi:hypothetical protein SZN_20567 [Streptomyces zinciresistens K42]|uniref:DUF397 domain-containing protein n=1 Tax=Streptomyces zinciresistens K42 TaxID=700597 RepID=G2GF30_9ACTN|nr:DUF397 domain-containing protein [Streptomyces zinciresistens]EGX57897.1 hypothetical protein SZN_20567 [Streptomyces zinciresistens K42]
MSGEKDRLGTIGLEWFKSSYSAGDGGQCVEVATRPGAVHVRDSKDTARAALTVNPTAWTAFVGFTAL